MIKDQNSINEKFRKLGELIIRFRWFFIILILVLDIVAFFGLKKIEILASDQGLFLKDDEIKKATEEFEEYFGNNDFVALLVESENIFNKKVLDMIRDLSRTLEDEVPFCDEVISITNTKIPVATENGFEIKKIIPDKIPEDSSKMKEMRSFVFSNKILINRLFSDDSKQTWIIVYLDPYPEDWHKSFSDHPEHVIGAKVTEILGKKRFRDFDIKATGYPVTQYEANVFFKKESKRTILLSILIAIFLLSIFLRSLRGVLFPVITTFSSILIVYGAMGYAGVKINNLVITVPVLLGMSISIGYSVHLFNHYRYRARQTGKKRDSILYALEHTGWPMFFTALTTFGSLLSFTFIPIKILQWLGIATASVILVVYFIVITLTPALLSFGKDETEKGKYIVPEKYSSESLFQKLGILVLRFKKIILILMIPIILISVAGIAKIIVKVDHKTTFGTKLDYIKKAHYIAGTKIGSLYCYNITLDFPEEEAAKDPEVLRKFEIFVNDIKGLELSKRVTSIIDIIKQLNCVLHGGNGEFFKIPEKKDVLAQLLLLYEMSGGTQVERWVDYDYRFIRILVEVKDYDTSVILKELDFLKKRVNTLFPGVKAGFSGVLYRVAHVQEYIIKGEIISFFIAILIIGILMTIVFRSFKAGLVGIIPNLASAAMVGGVMGFFNIPLNLITMTIIPMLLGIGVDDSIHYISHIKFEIGRGQEYKEATLRSFKAVGHALFVTTFILIAVFLIYMTSIVKMFFYFGLLSIAGLSMALIATYLLTPILINYFKPFK
ncbi:MAG: MMPL family transporter [Acidobacteriota bacterium]